jgi:hypothetical protein
VGLLPLLPLLAIAQVQSYAQVHGYVILFIYGGVHLETVMMLLDAELLEPNAS